MEHLVILGFVFLKLFMIVGAVDMFYYHMWKYKLHARPESRFEHKTHMAFAFLMVPIAFFLYYQDFGGYALWAGVIFVAVALVVEMLDVFSEGDSRASIGGLTTGEYALHVAATVLKAMSFAFIFGSKPLSAWSLESPYLLGSYGSTGEMMALQVMVGSFVIAVLHLALLNKRVASISFRSACRSLGCASVGCCATEQT